jgi:hypothetical protein
MQDASAHLSIGPFGQARLRDPLQFLVRPQFLIPPRWERHAPDVPFCSFGLCHRESLP